MLRERLRARSPTWFILCFSASRAANISDTFTPENGFFFCLTFFLVESDQEIFQVKPTSIFVRNLTLRSTQNRVVVMSEGEARGVLNLSDGEGVLQMFAAIVTLHRDSTGMGEI